MKKIKVSKISNKKKITSEKVLTLFKIIEGKKVSEVWSDYGTFFLEFGLPNEKLNRNHPQYEYSLMIGTPYTFSKNNDLEFCSDDELNKRESFLMSLKGKVISNILLEMTNGSLSFMLDDTLFQQISQNRTECDWGLFLEKDPANDLEKNFWIYPNVSNEDFILEN